jgi:hypothetical protein
LPGRTQQEAFDAFIDPIKRAISCVATAKLLRSKNDGATQGITLSPTPIRLTGSDYQLHIAHTFCFIEANREWRVTSLNYTYAIELARDNQKVVAFHWDGHGNGDVPFAHLHLGHANVEASPFLGPKAHIPTGRVAIEDVIYFLIDELRVQPLRHDWRNVLATARKPFITHKTW